MVKQIKLIDNVLTTVTTNILTPIGLAFEFNAKWLVDIEPYRASTQDEPAEGGAEITDIELFIGDSKKDCFEIFETLSDLESAIETETEYHAENSSSSCGSSFEFVAEYVECLVDLETKQIFYIEKDLQVFDKDLKKWIKTDFVHEITDYVPSDVLEWNLEQASFGV